MRSILKKIAHPFLKFGFHYYYKKPRKYTYDDIQVEVKPDVFPPHFTISTKLLLDFIKPIDLKDKSVLELGCGSGIIALYAASKNAKVMATDINTIALEAIKEAAIKNNLELQIVFSDLFQNIKKQKFEYIIINPPYYPKNPKNNKERAWFCGENFEYFKDLFQQLPKYLSPNTWLILSEDCNIQYIKQLANNTNLDMQPIYKKRIKGETNFIFNIKLKA